MMRTAVKSSARRVARRLPPPRDKAFLRMCVAARDLILGREQSRPAPVPAETPGPGDVPYPLVSLPTRPFSSLPGVTPLSESGMQWRTPPVVSTSGTKVRSIYDTGASAPRYDIELLEKLNAEYADKPLVPRPPKYDPESLTRNARRRILWVHNMIDLAGKRTLEIGCGNGYEVWHVGEHLAADAYGVDVAEYGPWKDLAGERVHFECADMAADNPFEPDYFDRIMSYTVWEHVLHPCKLLEETYRVLKPGGLCWMNANLYPGPQASHRYRDINFPWPHLLFSDDVIKEWDRKHGHRDSGSAWVNRLSWYHYQHYFDQVGFRLRHLKFTETAIDEEFYTRFEDILGRYPRWDLTKDFFIAVLEKPA
jgi:SAM-dependent methyltransferase